MIYITGDTHGEMNRFSLPLEAGDKLIVTGDFGVVFHGNLAERNNLDDLEKKPFEILFVDGNHEGFDYLETYPETERYGAPVRQLRSNVFWLQRGYVYTIEGMTFFAFGGAYSIDKAYRMKYQQISGEKAWFPQELPGAEEYRRGIANLQSRGMRVDYILSHTAPRTIVPRVIGKAPDPHEDELTGFLDWIYHEATFKKLYFGHFHMDMEINDQVTACFEELHRIDPGRD